MLFRKIFQKLRYWGHWLGAIAKRDGNPKTDEQPPYTHCMNCNTELTGMYCHKCGQYASSPVPKIFEFVKEYLKNVLLLDRLILPTISNLMFHPGHLIKEYCAGRYASYLHPIKLNFFILLVLIALFTFFGTDAKLKNSFIELTTKEVFISEMTLSTIQQNEEYLSEFESSPRDTVKLVASFNVVEKYGQIVDIVDVLSVTDLEEPDTLIASIPRVLIEDELLVARDDGYYFSTDNDIMDDSLMLNKMTSAWMMLISLLISYFPLLMFFSVPFLAYSIRLILIRRTFPKVYCFIFSLYYIAFVELLIIALLIAGLIFNFAFSSVRILLYIILFIYLTIALKQTYDIRTWFKSAIAAIFVNIVYGIVNLFMIMVLSLVIIVIVMI